jgi:pimeloyl-ACP methyl ester carboxylesterase
MTPRLRDLPFLAPTGFVRLAWAEWGPERGRTVVCAHGLTRNARDFDPLARELARRGWRVAAVDFPGRGRSGRLARAEDYGYPVYLAALAALVARLDAEPVAWVGTSMGGLAGMMLAAQPGTPVARLVVNDIGPFIPRASLERIAGYVGDLPRFADLAAAEAWQRRVAAPFGRLDDATWRAWAETMTVPDGAGGRVAHYDPAIALAFTGKPPEDVDVWPVWERVACPTLVLRGAESDLLLAGTAAEMTRRGPRARLAEIAGCGHAPALVDPAQLALVADFLDEAPP